ncbi:MAG TPA: type I-E CRISPR-associated protein Cse2/CasB [Thermoanaerobaculia bacterium]|nr:type I-E CRISPR-associated protein Cse2/CasB [Thermoanaerobaculia bacterium]
MSEPLQQPDRSGSQPPAKKLDSVVRRWWTGLDERRGDRAELRRARTPSTVAFLPAYHGFVRELAQAGIYLSGETAAVVAAVVAHVRRDDPSRSFAKQMASEHNGKARVSGLRFRRMLTIDDAAELQTSLVRTIHLLDGTASVGDLSTSIRWWNDRTKKRWASEYYETAPNED